MDLGLDHWLYGKWSLILLILGLALVMVLRRVTDSRLGVAADVFYRIGMLVIGGGHVILPLMDSEFSSLGYFTEDQFWNGFSIISCLPGPLFNLSVYVGTMIDGLPGGLVSFLALNIPSFLLIWGIIPYYQEYRLRPNVNRFIVGVCAASVGLILAAGVGLVAGMKGVFLPVLSATCLVIILVFKPPVIPVMAMAGLSSVISLLISRQ